ncbi:MAG: hypothetical protein ABFS28_05845 [Bacteroidota bacterium]
MKSMFRLKLLLFLFVLIVSGCKKEVPRDPRFSNFEEELEYLVEKYVRMGAAVGIIDKEQSLHRNTSCTDDPEW